MDNIFSLFRKKNLNLIKELTIADFKLRDQGSFLGFFWTLLHPALMFAVLYLIFSKWTGTKVENFTAFLLVGIVQWNFFASTTENALKSIVVKRELVKEINFPKEILVISSVLTISLSYLGELVVLFPLLFLIIGGKLSPLLVVMPLIIIFQLLFIIGISLILAAFFVFWRDIDRIWSIFLKIGFFATPIFYPISIISQGRQFWFLLNPMTHFINGARGSLIYGAIEQPFGLFVMGVLSLILAAFGYFIFHVFEQKFAEVL